MDFFMTLTVAFLVVVYEILLPAANFFAENKIAIATVTVLATALIYGRDWVAGVLAKASNRILG